MAALSIASASSGGKSAFDRAAILRDAHGTARYELAAYRAAVAPAKTSMTYRRLFASALRSAWQVAKDRAEDTAYQASLPPIPADVEERARELEADAYWSPINRTGNDRYTLLMGQARTLREEAREAAKGFCDQVVKPSDQLSFPFAAYVPLAGAEAIAAHT